MSEGLKGTRIRPMFLAGLLSMAIAPCLAAQDLPAALQVCRTEQDNARRLVCYDREVDSRVEPAAAGVAVPVAAPNAATSTAEESFGYGDVLAREEREKGPNTRRRLEELVATVTGVSKRPDGALEITLDNSQVWRQKVPDPYFRLKIGEQARIKPGALGSFLLYGNSRWSTRVTRVR